MNRRFAMLGSAIVGFGALQAAPALAQTGTQDVQLYAGYLFGDRLLERPLSGSTPRLNDNATFGARYTYHFTEQWGAQLSGGYSPGRTGHSTNGNTNLGLTTLDLDFLWDIPLNIQLAGHKVTPYAVAGAGYAWADFKHPIAGAVGTSPVRLTDSNGYTANAGLGLKYYLLDNFFVDFDARYRYLSRLVSNYGQGLNTTETTLSVGYRF